MSATIHHKKGQEINMSKRFTIETLEDIPRRAYSGTTSSRFFDEIAEALKVEGVAVKIPLSELKGSTTERKRAGLASRLRARLGNATISTRLDHEAGVVWAWHPVH